MGFSDSLIKAFLAAKKGLSTPVPGGVEYRQPEPEELPENNIPGVPLMKAAFKGTGAGQGINAMDTENDVRGRQALADSPPSLLQKFAERPDKVEGSNPSPEAKSMLQMFYERPDKVAGGNPSPEVPKPRPMGEPRSVSSVPSRPDYGYGPELDDAAIAAEQARARKAKKGHMVFEGLSKIGSGLTDTKHDEGFFNKLNEREDQGLKDIQTRRKGLGESQEYAVKHEQSDPSSAVNLGFRSMLKKIAPQLGKLQGFDNLTVLTGGPLEKMAEAYLKGQETRNQKQRELDDRNDRFTDKQVETFTGRYEKSGIPRLETAIGRLEKRAGKSIEEMSEKDLDGFGRMQNILPDWAYGMVGSKKGALDRGDVAEIYNATRHGDFAGNLTKNEQELFERANPSGSFVAEGTTLEGLRRAKQIVNSKKQNYTAGLNPDARRKAVQRGVLTEDRSGIEAKIEAARAAGYSDEEIQEFLRGR